MSTLSNNLQQIYTIKNQIKEVIGTASDVFAEYPAYISAAISGGSSTPTGTLFVMNQGQYDVSSYAYVAVCKEYSDDYGGMLSENTVGSYIGMTNAQTVDNSESIGTVDASFASELGTAFNVDLTPYIGADYVMFGDSTFSEGEVYGILIDTNAAFTDAGYPSPSSQTRTYLQFDMLGQLAWKNDNAGSGDVSSLVIGKASNIAVLNS